VGLVDHSFIAEDSECFYTTAVCYPMFFSLVYCL